MPSACRRKGGIVELNETRGTMHGYEIAWKAPTVQAAIRRRIAYMCAHFGQEQQP